MLRSGLSTAALALFAGLLLAMPAHAEDGAKDGAKNSAKNSESNVAPDSVQTTAQEKIQEPGQEKTQDPSQEKREETNQASGQQSAATDVQAATPEATLPSPASPPQDQATNTPPKDEANNSAAAGAPTAAPEATPPGAGSQPQDQVPNAPAKDSQATAPSVTSTCPGNPDALGTSRVLAIDPSQYKHVGRMQYPQSLPLNDKEVVLTFDDGPLPPYSNQILDILAAQCVKVTYFLVGSMARAYPSVVRREYEEGHTIGTHSQTHPLHFGTLPIDRMRAEIDGGIANVSAALGDSKYLAPFFRIPGLERSETLENELAARSLIVFSSDTVADDWHHGIKPNQIIALAMKRLEARGKGILLLHDIHAKTAAALPGLLKALKDNGFRIVQVVPSASYLTAMAAKPEHRILASAGPQPFTIGHGLDGNHQPAWPESSNDVAFGNAVLPAPDPSAFEPESGVTDDKADVQWPDHPPVIATIADEPRSSGRRHGKHAAHERTRHGKEARNAPPDKHHAERPHARHHERARAGAEGRSSEVTSPLKAIAALFTTAKTAR